MRFEITSNGKWTGGSFKTEAEANAAAAKLPKDADDVIEVRPKGGIAREAKPSTSATIPKK